MHGTPAVRTDDTTCCNIKHSLQSRNPVAAERNLISERSRDDADVSVSHERRLNKRLERLELEMVVMIGDGNCQFRALSTATCGDASQHPQLRALAVDWMREHREAFECFLGEDFGEMK